MKIAAPVNAARAQRISAFAAELSFVVKAMA
jgi:hypothetical protein